MRGVLCVVVMCCGVVRGQEGALVIEQSDIPNLSEVKERIMHYHDSGEWEAQIEEVVQRARRFLDGAIQGVHKPAVVLDIDETAISRYEAFKGIDFAYLPRFNEEFFVREEGSAVRPVLEFYRYAKERGCAIFFLTGRSQQFVSVTEALLKKVGYTTWTELVLRPAHASPLFKAQARRQIVARGYTILVNMGDQLTDLEGGAAEGVFKIPNPMYLVEINGREVSAR